MMWSVFNFPAYFQISSHVQCSMFNGVRKREISLLCNWEQGKDIKELKSKDHSRCEQRHQIDNLKKKNKTIVKRKRSNWTVFTIFEDKCEGGRGWYCSSFYLLETVWPQIWYTQIKFQICVEMIEPQIWHTQIKFQICVEMIEPQIWHTQIKFVPMFKRASLTRHMSLTLPCNAL